ncbi:MAG: MFS transporter [Albidovulum sp.]|nr:MFS transporter [Albidovulum sp.]MDE0307879.1 MFS transporter [Albidovulum sp.]MDE0533570.1 MFS transporter [Albidovulum sp.]
MTVFSSQVALSEADGFPFWRKPVFFLFLMAAAMPLSFSTWSALLNNFVIEAASFDGVGIGWLHTVREIPGFLAVGVIVLLLVLREQVLALLALSTLGAATAVVAWFPSFQGLLLTTLVASIGFHYFEAVNQSLQLQWINKSRAPVVLGWIVAIGSGASLAAYGLIVIGWKSLDLSYNVVYLLGGGATVLIALYCAIGFRQFESPNPQRRKLILRRRYWLFYALEFISGARRQIFVVFAAFMMVERFGLEVHEVTALFLLNYMASMAFAPVMGKAVTIFGERRVLVFEYAGLTLVFLAYGGIYYFEWGVVLAAALYILDHLFFALAFALRTYFQKIADPGDVAPTAAVAFTINHIAAVFLPALLGYLWIVSPGTVFTFAAALAAISVVLAALIPRHPAPGRETILSKVFRSGK